MERRPRPARPLDAIQREARIARPGALDAKDAEHAKSILNEFASKLERR